MNRTLGVQPWMSADGVQAVMAALAAKGGRGAARFVGGCVRNAVMGLAASDIDIATTLKPDQVVQALAAAGLKSVPTGMEHGTVTAVSAGRPYEITTLRRDVATDGRHAQVAFTDDWEQDAQRRDFRLNALYADADGVLYDPTGHGRADAREGRVVFVGDPQLRIGEDYLRILRFFRFFAWYGRGEPDAAALAACAACRDMLAGRPAERTTKELLKLLAADDPRAAVRAMARAGVLAVLLPGAGALAAFEGLVGVERDLLGENDPLLRLAALLPADPHATTRIVAGLRLSNEQSERLAAALGPTPAAPSSGREARSQAYRLGRQAVCDRIKLAWAAEVDPSAGTLWRERLDGARSWSPPKLPVNGEDALRLGAEAGPAVGRALRQVEDWWIDEDFAPGRERLLERLARAIGGGT